MLKVLKKSKKSKARLTELKTAHGKIMGPFFMPIATKAAVKNLSVDEIESLKPMIILSNTYHLMLTPGEKLIKKAGGLHKFMNWPKPILTDSGGFQVFSLSKYRKITEKGVAFAHPKSGAKNLLTPEKSMQIQLDLGVDIAMAFDEVIGYPATKKKVKEAMERTTRWAKRCKDYHDKHNDKKQLLFGIVQGGIHKDLREVSTKELVELDFDGYAVGGVAVGEPREKMKEILDWVTDNLPENKSRYLMGLGKPEEIVQAVKQGIDMFDCVIPTREARHHRLYVRTKRELKGKFYKTINITNKKFVNNLKPVNNTTLKDYSFAYLNHLFKTQEALGYRLATIHNLEFYLDLMKDIRADIKSGKL